MEVWQRLELLSGFANQEDSIHVPDFCASLPTLIFLHPKCPEPLDDLSQVSPGHFTASLFPSGSPLPDTSEYPICLFQNHSTESVGVLRLLPSMPLSADIPPIWSGNSHNFWNSSHSSMALQLSLLFILPDSPFHSRMSIFTFPSLKQLLDTGHPRCNPRSSTDGKLPTASVQPVTRSPWRSAFVPSLSRRPVLCFPQSKYFPTSLCNLAEVAPARNAAVHCTPGS